MDLHPPQNPKHHKRPTLSLIAFYSIGILSIIWLLVRSGTKPSRLMYPSQRTSAAYALNFLGSISFFFGSSLLSVNWRNPHVKEVCRAKVRINFPCLSKWVLIFSLFFLLLPTNEFPNPYSQKISFALPASDNKMVDLPPAPDPNPAVAVITRDYFPNEVEIAQMVAEAITAVLGPGGLNNLVDPGDNVLIKPNLGCGYAAHETTDWQVVKPIVQATWHAGASSVTIAEGEGCNYGMTVFDLSGYTANITNVDYVNFNDTVANPTYNVTVTGGYWDEPIVIPQIYYDADVVITVPTLKTHNEAGVTLGLKNAFGVPPVSAYNDGFSYRVLLHIVYGIRKTIPQINLAKKPDLAVVDAILGGEGQGPWSADPVVMNTILAGRDLVALDAVGTAIIGIDTERIPYLTYAQYKNLGVKDLDAIQIVGTPIANIRKDFALPAEAPYIYRKSIVMEKTAQPLDMDGSLDDWYSVKPSKLVDETSVISGSLNWSGSKDLSLAGRFLYDQDSVYAILTVLDDDKITNSHPELSPPQGDMLEFYLSLTNPWSRLGDPVYGAGDYHLGVGYAGNPVLWDIGRGETILDAQVALLDTSDGYIVELSIPFSSLDDFSPRENEQVGLDFTVIDMDTLQTGDTTMAWSGGVNLPDDPRAMGVALLGPQRASQNLFPPSYYLPLVQSPH